MTRRRWRVYYDGECALCRRTASVLKTLDWFGRCAWVPFQGLDAPPVGLSWEDLQESAIVEMPEAEYHRGYFAFRKLAQAVPLLVPLVPILHLPPVARIGVRFYRWIADHRHCAFPETEPHESQRGERQLVQR